MAAGFTKINRIVIAIATWRTSFSAMYVSPDSVHPANSDSRVWAKRTREISSRHDPVFNFALSGTHAKQHGHRFIDRKIGDPLITDAPRCKCSNRSLGGVRQVWAHVD